MSKGKKPGKGGSGGEHPPGGPPFKGVGDYIKHSIGDMLNVVIATALQIEDPEAARARLRTLATVAFFGFYGAAIGKLDAQISHLEEEYTEAKARLKDLRGQLAATLEWIPSARENQGRDVKDHVQVPLWKWQFRHLIGGFVLSVLLIGALAASMVTAHYNLKGTELPFFDNDVLAWSMAGLAPLSAIATKTMASQMRREQSRVIFQALLMISAGLAIVAWIVLFAWNYHGLSTGLSLEGFLDELNPGDELRDTAFVAVSLFLEVTAGALIATKLDQISSNYAPNY